jgi:hypothetical protein
MTSMPTSKLRVLSNLIADTVTAIEQTCSSKNIDFPDLDTPFSLQSESRFMDPDISGPAATIIAAATQLSAILRPAQLAASLVALQVHV